MKTYTGKRLGPANELPPLLVEVITPTGRYPLPHIEKHSPDGFQWGYLGSGPSDLAYAILADYKDEAFAKECYHDFKCDFVGKFKDKWVITEQDICDWYEAGLWRQ
jgi:hypothetical protein